MEARQNKYLHKIPSLLMVILRTLFFIGMIYVLLYPMIVMLSRAFRTVGDMYNPSIIWIPQHFTFKNFKEALELLSYGKTAIATGRVAIVCTFLTMASCSLMGYALGRFDFKLSKVIIAITILTVVVPIQTYLIPLFFKFRFFDFFSIGLIAELFVGKDVLSANLANSELPYYLLAATGMGIRSGLFILVFYQFFKTVPKELDDASRIDGCGEWGTFFKVMLPSALPPYLVTFVLSLVWYWNDTVYGSVLMRKSSLLASKLANIKSLFIAASGNQVPDIAEQSVVIFAAAILFIIPPLIMYLIVQRFFMQSIERTGIVG